jgi:hypothetical protein
VAGLTFCNIYFKLVKGAVRAPDLVAFERRRGHRFPVRVRL